MKKGPAIVVIGEREASHIVIEPTAKVVSGWRTVNISVRCGAWGGHYAGQFMEGELKRFGKEVEFFSENRRPTAELHSAEHYLLMKLVNDGHGKIYAEGEARERMGAKTALAFEFEVDPATLPAMARALIEADG